MWKEGVIGIPDKDGKCTCVHFRAKVYKNPSQFGINKGRISKLELRIKDKIIAHFERGWDILPTCYEAKMALAMILDQYK